MNKLDPVAVGVHRAVLEAQQRAAMVRWLHEREEQTHAKATEFFTHTVPGAPPHTGGGQ